MRKRLNADMVNVNGKTVNVGIDVHKQSWQVTALIEGVVVTAVTIKPSYGVLQKLLAQFKGAKIRIAYEAGPAGFNLYDDLTADGIPEIVAGPMYTNRNDDPELVTLNFVDTDGEPFQVNVSRRQDRASLWVYDGATRELLASREVPGHDLYGILVADFDSDGTTEIAVGDRRGCLRIYTIVDGQLAVEWESDDLGTGIVGMAFGDAADSGHGQLFCGTEDGRLHQITANPDTYTLNWTSPDLGSHLWGIVINDLDNDGTEEIVTANGNGTLFVFEGKSHRLEYRRDGLGTLLGAYNSILVADLDRDGHKDVILGSSGYIYVFEAST